jgi:hypothetical protein
MLARMSSSSPTSMARVLRYKNSSSCAGGSGGLGVKQAAQLCPDWCFDYPLQAAQAAPCK